MANKRRATKVDLGDGTLAESVGDQTAYRKSSPRISVAGLLELDGHERDTMLRTEEAAFVRGESFRYWNRSLKFPSNRVGPNNGEMTAHLSHGVLRFR